uniref:Transcription initiation factor TFIID subunit 12 n=1 Tax=Acrobeloides nanus TaxID=290746 RepID=A0A914CPC8_9BILA
IKIDDILSQMDPSAQLNDDVKEALLEFLNDYIDKILEKSCQVAKYRGSKKVDPKDVEYVIKRIHKP